METYLVFKSLHLLGVVLFIGNIVATGVWKVQADRTRDPRIVAFAQRQVIVTDWIFTLGGAVLTAIGGYGNVIHGGVSLATSWVWLAHWIFLASGLVWLAVLVPLQVRMGRMARAFADGSPIPEAYWQANRWWLSVGIADTLLPAANIWVMVNKPVF